MLLLLTEEDVVEIQSKKKEELVYAYQVLTTRLKDKKYKDKKDYYEEVFKVVNESYAKIKQQEEIIKEKERQDNLRNPQPKKTVKLTNKGYEY